MSRNYDPNKPHFPQLSTEDEDKIIHTRIINDEKALRRMAKKFHTYTSVAYDSVIPLAPGTAPSVEDARDAFLIELAAFHLSLKKNLMVCEAETRQVEEYKREKERIENERIRLKGQIEELKLSLEQAQLHRKRKMEYDVIAERINALPSREELEQSIASLENDMTAIRSEQEDQDRILQAQHAALGGVIASIQHVRTLGKQDLEVVEDVPEPPAAEARQDEDGDVEMKMAPEGTGDIPEEKEEGEEREEGEEMEEGEERQDTEDKDHRMEKADDEEREDGEEQEDGEEPESEREEGEKGRDSDDDVPLASKLLNPSARSFVPSTSSRVSTPVPHSNAPTPGAIGDSSVRDLGHDDDIEMGELADEPKDRTPVKLKKAKEDLEEGEASDMSSELSEVPSDTEY